MPMPASALSLADAPVPAAQPEIRTGRPSLTLVPSFVPSPPNLSQMFRCHLAFVRRNLGRLGVPTASVEDAAQDVFIVAQRHLDKFRGGTSERAWLSAIALRVASDYRRAATLRATIPIHEVMPVAHQPSALDIVAHRQELGRANAALQHLSSAQRSVFLLADVEELTAPEIAERTQTKLATVYTRMLAARKRFSAALAGEV